MFIKKLTASVGVMALALSLAACSDPATSKSGAQKNNDAIKAGYFRTDDSGDPVQGGTLTFASASEPLTMSPARHIGTGDSSGAPMAAVYDTLIRYNQEANVYEPWLAESLEASDDNLVWTLKLRDGVTFSDGSAFDAKAVLASLEYYRANYGYLGDLMTASLSDSKATDDLTVVFTSKRPWATFPSVLAQGPGMIMAPAAYAGKEFTPIGAGPFVVADIAPGEHILVKARADYWGGKPNLDAVKFVPMVSQQTQLDSLRSGGIQAATISAPQLTADLLADQSISGTLNYANMGILIDVNQREGLPAADPRVREAVALAIDPELYFERSYEGNGLPYKGIFGPGSKWHSDAPVTPVDLDKAKDLVAEAKKDGWDGKIRFTATSDPLSKQYGQAIKAMLDRVGFEVIFDFTTGSNALVDKVFIQHDFDLALSTRNVQEDDPHQRLRNLLYSTSGTNTLGYQSVEMDKLIDDLGAAVSEDEQRALIAQIDELWRTDYPAVPLGAMGFVIAWDKSVHGVVSSAVSIALLGGAWIDKK